MAKGYAEPVRKVGTVTQQQAVPVRANDEFMLVFFPTGWDFVQHRELQADGKRGEPVWKWLPRLKEVPIKRGANGIDTDGNVNAYVGTVQGNGGVAFRNGDKALGPYRDFVMTLPCEKRGRKGTYHLTEFERPVVLGGVMRSTTDDHARRDMLCYLVEQGVIEPMSEVVLLHLLEQQERRIASLEVRAASAPHLLKRATAAQLKLGQMRSTWQRQFGEDAEEPKPSVSNRGRKPKAEA